MILNKDSSVSPSLASVIWEKRPIQDGKNSLDLPGRPNNPFNWDEPIVKAAADVNPDTTGNEIKSTRKPENKENKVR